METDETAADIPSDDIADDRTPHDVGGYTVLPDTTADKTEKVSRLGF